MKNLGKIRTFRAAAMINCKKQLPNLDKDFFLENTMILGQKLRNMTLISSKDLFFLENTRCWDELWSLSENLRQLFCPIRKVLENHNLSKTILLLKIFLCWYAYDFIYNFYNIYTSSLQRFVFPHIT